MNRRTAECVCGQFSVRLTGEPIKVSACHCASCQKRTGSAFSVAVFFRRDAARIEGAWRSFRRPGDSGLSVDFRFCPVCGSTVLWFPEFRPEWIGVAIGCLADPSLKPSQSVYETGKREWVQLSLDG